MGIFLRQSHNVKPRIWGSPTDVQYSIWRNLENIYGCDHESEVLIMPMFWGFPLLDYSKYGNHGTNHGATYKDGSLDFDGDDAYVELTNEITFFNGYTLTMCFKGDSGFADPNGKMIIGKIDSDNYVSIQDNLLRIQDNSSNNHDIPTTFNHAELYFLTLIHDNNYWKLYKNGAYINQDSGIDSLQINAIGIGYSFDLYEFDGIIDEVRISNAARTADQIGLFYENPYGLYRRVAKPIWSIPAAPSIYIPQIIMF